MERTLRKEYAYVQDTTVASSDIMRRNGATA